MDDKRQVILVELDEADAEICATALGCYTGIAAPSRAVQAGDLLDRIETAVQIEKQPGGALWPR